jgi:hypothetical protein
LLAGQAFGSPIRAGLLDVREAGGQQARLELLHSFQGLARCEELHADHIEEILSFLAVQQGGVRQQRAGLAVDAFQGLSWIALVGMQGVIRDVLPCQIRS